MDTIDVYEPEVYVASTQGPQFSDLFSTPSPPPKDVTDHGLFSIDEPDDKNTVLPKEAVPVSESVPSQNGSKIESLNCLPQIVPLSNLVSMKTQPEYTDNETEIEGKFSGSTVVEHKTITEKPLGPQGYITEQSTKTETTIIEKTHIAGDQHKEETTTVVTKSHTQVTEQVQEGGVQNFSSLLIKGQQKVDDDDEFDFETPSQTSTMPKQKLGSVEEASIVLKQETHTQDVTCSLPPLVVNNAAQPLIETNDLVTKESNERPSEPLSNELIQAEDEWAAVQTIVPEVQNEGGQSGKKAAVETMPIVSYTEAYQHSIDSDLQQYKSQIKTSVQRSGFKALKHALFGPPKLHRDLIPDRDNVFCLALYSFSNEDPVHLRILQTIYKRLTGAKLDCRRFGSHWEQIGFQGNDPSTDLRGCGMLGLLHILFMLTTPKYLPMARDIYKLSLHETQNFPFCVMGINITRITIQALREDCLNKEINKERSHSNQGSLFKVFNEYYTAIYYHLYTIWKTQHKTIADTGFVIKDVETIAKKNPGTLLVELERHLQKQKQVDPGTNNDVIAVDEPLKFSKFNDE